MTEHIFEKIDIADKFSSRLHGMTGIENVPDGYAMFFPRCSSIHMMHMSVALDIVYLDGSLTILGIETLKPWKFGHAPKGTRNVLETKDGWAAAVHAAVGDRIDLAGCWEKEHRRSK
jgi:uncharacterized membrane protein (UPF0127 family)